MYTHDNLFFNPSNRAKIEKLDRVSLSGLIEILLKDALTSGSLKISDTEITSSRRNNLKVVKMKIVPADSDTHSCSSDG